VPTVSKVILCFLILASVALGLLAGCGRIGGKYTYIEWYSSYFEKYYPRWFEEFERAHADRNVRIRFRAVVGNFEQVIYTMLISHTLCDCIAVGPSSAALLLENAALEPLTDEDVDHDDFPALSIKLGSQDDGEMVSYPLMLNMRPFLYFNREAFRQGDTSEKEIPDTFAEYRRWAPSLFKWELDGKIVYGPLSDEDAERARMLRRPIGMIRGFAWSAIPLCASYMEPLPDENGRSDLSVDDFFGGPPSGRPFRFDTPEFIRGLEEYRDFYLPKETAVADGDTGRVRGFQEGIYAGAEGSNWIYGEVLKIDMQITKLPRAQGRPRRVWMTSSGVGVSRESANKELAKEFARFITRPESQIDAYYGHGYLPASLTAWRRLGENDRVDEEIYTRFLDTPRVGRCGYVGVPRVKRRYHDVMDIYLHAPHTKDVVIMTASAAPGEEAAFSEDVPELAGAHRSLAGELAVEVAEFAGVSVNVIVRGTPEDMIDMRSFRTASPVPVYAELLESGIYVPLSKEWARLQGEVIRRVCQFVSRAEEPMAPADAAAWAQKEAEDILAGRK
jgi:ABC-type glycerol-3-phosphate transport system substrate-binding protein